MNNKANKISCRPGKFLSGVYRLLNKIKEKSLFIKTLSKEDPGQQPAGTTTLFIKNNKNSVILKSLCSGSELCTQKQRGPEQQHLRTTGRARFYTY